MTQTKVKENKKIRKKNKSLNRSKQISFDLQGILRNPNEFQNEFQKNSLNHKVYKFCFDYIDNIKETGVVTLYYGHYTDLKTGKSKFTGIRIIDIVKDIFPMFDLFSKAEQRDTKRKVQGAIFSLKNYHKIPFYHPEDVEGYIIPTKKEQFELLELQARNPKNQEPLKRKINLIEAYKNIAPNAADIIGKSNAEIAREVYEVMQLMNKEIDAR